MSETLKKLVVNLAVWAVFGLVLVGMNKFAPNVQDGHLAPVTALKRLVEPTLVILQVLGVLLLLGILAILSFKFKDPRQGPVAEVLELASDEAGSILTNFASLLVVAGLVAREGLSPYVVAGGIYVVAYFILFRPRVAPKRQSWTAIYPKIDGVEEAVSLKIDGDSATGVIRPTKGPDFGRSYVLKASARDRMLVGFFEDTSEGIRDKGAFTLLLDNVGDTYSGHIVYTHDTGELIQEQWVWRRAQ